MRMRLIFLLVIACQIALFLGASSKFSWWDGP